MIKFKVKVMLAIREMTQKELAERTGIRPPTVSAICTGAVKHFPVEALNEICKVLDCQPADIMEYVPDEVQGCTIKQLVSRTVLLAYKMPKVSRKMV